ncbi:MAG: D-sedoheptulose 7-phosphate isomerase [Deltaproteobacteria bacterium]|nr:D-sedoheptulose 7-phosphate isomerase [Deltaproteobacteria bacterium]
MNPDWVDGYFSGLRAALDRTEKEIGPDVERLSQWLLEAFRGGHKVLAMGNGGSASDAQHFAAELVGRFLKERRGLAAIALNDNPCCLTAVANDYGFGQIFRRQVEALAVAGDVVVGISTSGHSANVLEGLDAARKIGCRTVALLGRGGGEIAKNVDLAVIVPDDRTPHIQEMHIAIIHMICQRVEETLFPAQKPHE